MAEKSVIGPAIMCVICLGFAATGGYLFWSQEQAINNAEQINGTIESATVDEETALRDVDDDGQPEERTDYYANITYTYTVDGTQYQSSNVFPGGGDPSVGSGEANSLVEQYQPGSEATVYVNTDNPSSAYLVQERSLVLPVGFMLFGGILAILAGFTTYSRLTGGGTDDSTDTDS